MPDKNITKNTAKEFAKKVNQGNEFVTQSGAKVHDLFELYDIILEMDDDEFYHHVNANKNDFKNWIYHIVKDKRLAEIITPIKSRTDILAVIEKRIDVYKELLADPSKITKRKPKKNSSKKAVKKTIKKVVEKVPANRISDSKKSTKKSKKKSVGKSGKNIVSKVLAVKKKSTKKKSTKKKSKKKVAQRDNLPNISLKKESKPDLMVETKTGLSDLSKKGDVRKIKTKVVHYDDYVQLKKERDVVRERGFDFIQGMFIGIILGIIISRIIFGV